MFCCGRAFCVSGATNVHAEHVAGSAPVTPGQGPRAIEYTCPMHAQIRRPAPGNCPICGMTLEPVLPVADKEDTTELDDFSRRFWWTLPLTLIAPRTQSWVELALATPVVLWAAWPFFVRAAQSVINRSPNMWSLIGLGGRRMYNYNVVGTLAPQIFPASFVVHGRVGVYFEAAAVIVSLTLLGQLLELHARSQTSAAIKTLLQLAPKTARRIHADGGEEDVPLTDVHPGDHL